MTKTLLIAVFLAGALLVLTNGPEGRSEPPGVGSADSVGVLTAAQATELGGHPVPLRRRLRGVAQLASL